MVPSMTGYVSPLSSTVPLLHGMLACIVTMTPLLSTITDVKVVPAEKKTVTCVAFDT